MSTMLWCLLYVFTSLIYKWILSWGGARRIKGWKSSWFLDAESESWNEEQIKAMALFLWIGSTVLFVVGLIYPEFRFY